MISQFNPFLSGEFDPENAVNYNLLLSITENNFSYAVVENDTLLALGTDLPLDHILAPLTLNGQENIAYKQVVAGIIPPNFSIVPDQLFQEDGIADMAAYLNVAAADKILSQDLNGDNKIIYNCSETVYQQLADKYPAAYLNFFYKGWLQAIAKKSPFNENIYLDINNGFVHIANFKNHKLRFYNCYAIADENDLVYFTALVADELTLDKGDILISVSGNVEAGDVNINTLKEFFRQVEISKINILEHLPEEAEPQQVLAMSALTLCV